ncbi:MAG TPA: amidohydrolase family protein [Vicinamibacterales bacterium]|nr:amidohydrolase family protein [Vicinamibacterales bacterium]
MNRREALTRLGQLGAMTVLGPPLRGQQDDRTRLPAPLLDAHAHLISRDLATWMRNSSADADVRRAIRPVNGRIIVDALEEDGIPRAIALSSACLHASDSLRAGRRKKPADEHRDVQNENDFTALQAREHAPVLIPFASVNPKRDYAVDELVRCVETHRMRGVTVHFGDSDVRLREAVHLTRVQALFAEAAKRGVPVIAHIFNDAVKDFGTADLEILMGQLVEPFPALRLSIAHLGGPGGAAEQGTLRIFGTLINAVRARPQLAPQLWADCSSVLLTEPRPGARPISPAQQLALGRMLREWGIDRLMWGTDAWTDRHPSSLTQARQVWPLGDAEWGTLASFDGSGFLPRSGT